MHHSTGAEPGSGRNDVAIWLRSGMAFRFSFMHVMIPNRLALSGDIHLPSIWRYQAETSSFGYAFQFCGTLCQSLAIIACGALVSPETICYTPRAGRFRLLPRAVVAELVDAQR